MKTDIEIAQSTKLRPITEIADIAGIADDYLEQYGKYKAKINLSLLNETAKPDGKLILVTAITPTAAGEGKTTTTVGLADGLRRIGKKSIVALREPSPLRSVLWAAGRCRFYPSSVRLSRLCS